ncbi:hypothetical protein Dimus_004923 [Dionaea muscipula]
MEMEDVSGFHGVAVEEPMDLAPGFRFHPTDEELITHYLSPKVLDSGFSARAIGDVDLNKCEPWDLPRRAKMGEKEFYFFCVRDRKYPTGLRTNRATEAGYWKATGKDKEIFRGKSLVGMKKTLVFYKGRAPKGEKSNWVMHEYRLEGRFSLQNLPPSARNEWVICRVFQKSAAGKKIPYPGLMMRSDSFGSEFGPSSLPPLVESSPYSNISDHHQAKAAGSSIPGSVHVPCFSSPIAMNMNQPAAAIFEGFNNNNNNNTISSSRRTPLYFQSNMGGAMNTISSTPPPPPPPQIQENNFMSEHVRAILESNYGVNVMMKQRSNMKTERDLLSVSQDTGLTSSDMNAEISSNYDMGISGGTPFDDQEGPSTSAGPYDIDELSFWNKYY